MKSFPRFAVLFLPLGLVSFGAAEKAPDAPQITAGAALHELSAFVTDCSQLPIEKSSWGSLHWLCNGKLSPGAAQTFGIAEILPGKANPMHYHPNCEEVLHVLSGRGQHSFDGQVVELKAGMTIRIPAGVKHNLVNTGTEPIRTVIAFSSGDRKTVFLEDNAKKNP